jgi:hypothetical protein
LSARVELESKFGSLDEGLYNCVKDYIVDVMGVVLSPPKPPSGANSKKQRRSRSKNLSVRQCDEMGILSGILSDIGDIWSDDGGLLRPSDLDDLCW